MARTIRASRRDPASVPRPPRGAATLHPNSRGAGEWAARSVVALAPTVVASRPGAALRLDMARLEAVEAQALQLRWDGSRRRPWRTVAPVAAPGTHLEEPLPVRLSPRPHRVRRRGPPFPDQSTPRRWGRQIRHHGRVGTSRGRHESLRAALAVTMTTRPLTLTSSLHHTLPHPLRRRRRRLGHIRIGIVLRVTESHTLHRTTAEDIFPLQVGSLRPKLALRQIRPGTTLGGGPIIRQACSTSGLLPLSACLILKYELLPIES